MNNIIATLALGLAVVVGGAGAAQAGKYDVYGYSDYQKGWFMQCDNQEARDLRWAIVECQKHVGGYATRIGFISARYATKRSFTRHKVVTQVPNYSGPTFTGYFCSSPFTPCPK